MGGHDHFSIECDELDQARQQLTLLMISQQSVDDKQTQIVNKQQQQQPRVIKDGHREGGRHSSLLSPSLPSIFLFFIFFQ